MKNIYVGNISFQTTEQDLDAAFSAYGQVDRVQIVKDRETGQARGFAFVRASIFLAILGGTTVLCYDLIESTPAALSDAISSAETVPQSTAISSFGWCSVRQRATPSALSP